eukprot:1095889-Amphidinium_carterae.3
MNLGWCQKYPRGGEDGSHINFKASGRVETSFSLLAQNISSAIVSCTEQGFGSFRTLDWAWW